MKPLRVFFVSINRNQTHKPMERIETLNYSDDNIKELESNGYKKSPVSKPMSKNKVIRYSMRRGVYWFSNSCSAHNSDCTFVRQNVGQLIII